MADHKPLYRWSLQDAIAHNEVQDWRDSYKENCDCARAIERAIADHYHDNVLEDGTKDVLDRYGFDRVNWVLANTLQEKAHDGRFSQENKKWAKGFFIPSDDVRWHFCVESHPGLTDLFIDQAREAWHMSRRSALTVITFSPMRNTPWYSSMPVRKSPPSTSP